MKMSSKAMISLIYSLLSVANSGIGLMTVDRGVDV